MPSKNPAMETNESGAPDLLAGAGDGAHPSHGAPPKPSPPEGAPGAPSATEPGPDGEILVLQTTNGATTMGLAAQPTSQSTNQQLSQLNGQAFQNGLLNLALAGALRDDDGFRLAPEEVASISSYSSVSSPEILSPRNPRTPEIPQVDFSDTQCSLVHKAEDLNIKEGFNATNQTNGVVDSSWILLGKRESVAPDSGDEAKRTAGPQDGVFDLSGAISSSQFIFTQFGKGVPSTFTSSAVTATSNTTCTTKPLPQTVEQAVSATPPAKRLKQPSLSVPHPSKVGPYELKIVAQPEEQHRARYLTEGSRGSVKDRSGSSYPTVQLVGYSAGPATLQVFVGCDSGKVKPHGFYQACKVYGKSANQFEESEVDGTQVIEIQMEPDTDMKVCIDCVGILKLRNADVEARIGPVRSKKRSNRARLVFRVQVPNGDGSCVTLQTASQPILCTQPVGQPEICRMSLTSAPYNGGVDLYLIGKNFLKGSKVIFRETNGKEETVWEKEAQIDPEFFHQMHIICTVPSYDHERLLTPRAVSVVVDSAGRLSEGYHFTYTPGPQQAETQTNAGNAANATSWQTYRVPEVVGVVHCGAGGLDTKQVIKMETEPAVPAAVTSVPVHQVTMETNAAPPLPPDSLFPLVQDVGVGVGVGGHAVQQPQSQTPPGVNTRRINSLDEDSPTSTKPTGMLMDSDPMVSSTISMGVTPPNPPAAFPLVSESSNEMAPWTEAANQTPSKSADVFVDESKVNSEPWNSDSTVTKMEVSHETYKSEDQWQNPQWTQNQTTNQWPTETAADQWTPTKTESLPVEIPKTNVWSENVQSYGDSAEPSGFENSWNSVIEVPVATNTESQWPTAASSGEPVKNEHVTFAPAQCAPEMALAPKEFTSPVAQVAPEMALAPEGFTTTYSSDQNQSSLAGATKKEAVLPLAPDNQTATVVLRNQHGGQAVLITAEDLVKDAHTILANSNNFIAESSAVAAVTESSNVGASVPHQPSVTTYLPQETTNVFAPANQAPQTLNFQSANLVQQSNTVVMSPTQTISAQNPTQYVDQNSQAHLATNFAVPATIVNTTSLEQSFAPVFTNSSAPSQTVPVLISSQNTTPKTFVILTKDQVPITHVQVITAPPPSEQQVQVQQQAQHQVQVQQQQQQLQQQQQVPVHNTATATSQTGYQTAVTTATSFTSGGAVGAQQQQQQSTMAFQPVLQQTTEGATSTPAPMVLGETGSGAAPSQGAQGAHPGAQQGAPAPAMKDGLSGGTLPTISFEDVCDILRDEMNTT